MLFNTNEYYHKPEFYGGDEDSYDDYEEGAQPVIIGGFDLEFIDSEESSEEKTGGTFHFKRSVKEIRDGKEHSIEEERKEEGGKIHTEIKEESADKINIYTSDEEDANIKTEEHIIDKANNTETIDIYEKTGDDIHTQHIEKKNNEIIDEKDHKEHHEITDKIEVLDVDNGKETKTTKTVSGRGQDEKRKKYKNLLQSLRETK